MISGMGGGIPSMDAMRQMQQKMFAKADVDGSSGLDAKEFSSMVENSPMAGKAGKADEMFKKIDSDGSGELSAEELGQAHEQMMARFQSTMQAFGGASGSASASSEQDEAGWQTLLDAIGNGSNRSDGGHDAGSGTDLRAQLETLLQRLGSTYGVEDNGGPSSLLVTA
jgi:hypothetical protein